MSRPPAAPAGCATSSRIPGECLLGGRDRPSTATFEHPVERMARDVEIYPIVEGTSEIQRLVIARAISGAQR